MTYPENMDIGRSNQPEQASAQYGRGKALAVLGCTRQALAAYREGAMLAQGLP